MAEEIVDEKSPALNEQQLQMLKLFRKPMANEDYHQIRRFIVGILAKNIDDEMADLEAKNNWTSETYESWGQERLRTTGRK
ncbi:hypothetical protein [Parapedobacter sp. 10938]|uniref:hypothetical protein n=1 Tax=Parapedobacter flavus TaxID=3110225 RepID=UPI002DB90010|nr:hypothetical protein [Parapedobacter sp. 10938]MEC3880707.1 hypothetical protein [Parapedobacter sp. 10938]